MSGELSLVAACWWTFVRTSILCLLAWPLIVKLENWLRGLADTRRPFALTVLLAPFLFPELLVGYSFRKFAMASPHLAEWLCAFLLFIRIVPVGVVTLLVSPAALISAAAIHCRWMLVKADPRSFAPWRQLVASYWYGPVQRTLPAMGLMSLVAFQEFELAALLQTASWTDWFITAERFGFDRSLLFQKAIWPLVMQLPLLVGAFVWLKRREPRRSEQDEIFSVGVRSSVHYAILSYLGFALICGCFYPLVVLGRYLPEGLGQLVKHPTQMIALGRETLVAGAVSLCAGLSAWFAGCGWPDSSRSRRASMVLQQFMILPGLIGSLLLSLATVGIFQHSWLVWIYDSPIPWTLALIVWLLPRAVLLRLWLSAMTRTESVHLAEMLTDREQTAGARPGLREQNPTSPAASFYHSRRLVFRLRDQPRLLGMGLLCYWAYLDLSTAYLLAPSGMASGLVRLYNMMHFGRFAALSAESFLFFGIPVILTLVIVRLLQPR